MAEYIEYHPLKFWLDPASIAEIVAHIQTYLVNNPINSTTEIETIIHDYLIAHPELIGGVESVNGETGEVVLTADNISGGENVTIKDVLDSLQDQIDDIVVISTNRLNPENIKTGYFYSLVDVDGRYMIKLVENSAYSCAYIDVVEGISYVVTGISYNAFNGDSDGYGIGYAARATNSTPNVVFDTSVRNSSFHNQDKTINRVYFSWRHASYPSDTYMANEGTTLLPYTPWGEGEKSLSEDINVPNVYKMPKVYVVDVNGSGDYVSLMAAFTSLANDTDEKIIKILSGTYDIYEEIGGDTFVNSIPSDASSYWDYVTIVPPNTSIIGIGGVTLQYLPESVPEIAASFISPLNISDGNVSIENINIVCKNCRYGIHDQTREDHPTGYTHLYKNVTITKDNSSGYTGMVQALGGGLTQGANIIVEDCVFQSYRIPFSFHNAHKGYGNIILMNSAFNNLQRNSTYPSLRFGNVSGVQTHVRVNISGSYIKNGVLVTNESSTERPNAFDVSMVNCIGTTTITVNNTVNIYAPKVFNT